MHEIPGLPCKRISLINKGSLDSLLTDCSFEDVNDVGHFGVCVKRKEVEIYLFLLSIYFALRLCTSA